MKYTFFYLSLVILPLSNLWAMGEIPLKPMHNAAQVIREFNNTIVRYAAITTYLTGPQGLMYSINPGFGFVSSRSTTWDYQPNVVATHSLKKFINVYEWVYYSYEEDQESLLTNASVYEGKLEMRAATQNEIDEFCKAWCPCTYDLDYEESSDIEDVANKYCCPADICCLNMSNRFLALQKLEAFTPRRK